MPPRLVEVELAKVKHVSVHYAEDPFKSRFEAEFRYEGGWNQCLLTTAQLWIVDGFLAACGVETLPECVGRIVRVAHAGSGILSVASLGFEKPVVIDVSEVPQPPEAG